MTDFVTIFEMAPRDGLQNEARPVATDDKVRLVNALTTAGVSKIEVTSFVSPKWVPQMADAAEVMAGITRAPGVSYAVLVPNMQGYEKALTCRPTEIAVFASASEGFSRKNINCSVRESLDRFRPVLNAAARINLPVRGYVSCVTECPYDGAVAPQDVASVAEALVSLGCYEISLGDTIGTATPDRIGKMLEAVIKYVPADRLAGHYHDTKGNALANIATSLDYGLRVFDGSVGGLGGCPYAPGAKGNVATEKVFDLLTARGFHTNINAARLQQAAAFARTLRTGA